MRKLLLLTLFFSFVCSLADAQGKRGKSFRWKKKSYRYELIGSIGAANFLGDLGGADQIGTHGIKDLEYVLTRPALAISIRYKILNFFSVKNNFAWGIVRGDDKLTKEPFRNNRNLSFKSNIFELSSQAEFNFVKDQKGHVYRIKGVRGMHHKDRQIYLFGGAGLFYFNPKAQYNGQFYALQPLGTEGQGLPGYTKKYSRISGLLSVGGGMRFAINRNWGVGFEIGLRKTFTDYIDDVSKTYATDAIRKAGGSPQAIYFADPSEGHGWNPKAVSEGYKRGNPKDNDAYMFALFTVGYKVMYKKRSRSKF